MKSIMNMEKLKDSEVREERELMREYAYLNKLKECVEERNKAAAMTMVKKIHRYEVRLERTHQRTLNYLEALNADGLSDDEVTKLDELEDDIGFFLEDIKDSSSGDDAELIDLVEREEWDMLEEYVIRNLKRDIRRWLELDKALIEFENELMSY